MSGKIEARLKELGIELPQASAPVANYVPFTRSGNLVVGFDDVRHHIRGDQQQQREPDDAAE